LDLFSPLRTETPQLTSTDPGEKSVWLYPELVCEVAYQQLTRDHKLQIPRFIRIRTDKKPEECTFDQLTENMVSPGWNLKAYSDLSSSRKRGSLSGAKQVVTPLPSPMVTVTRQGIRH